MMLRILGCWYSTAQIHPKILHSSLQSIDVARLATQSAAAMVKTCTWESIPGNPFEEFVAHHRQPSHLGITMQILRILLEEQAAGHPYDAVCFLEHDVLYPHDYFDQVARVLAKDGEIQGVRNENYIGMNHTGWLAVGSRREPPLHQLSLRWAAARGHLDSLVRRCILRGGVRLEPTELPGLVARSLACAGPACHMNHSGHFTNHHECYESDARGAEFHPYWGDFRQYYPDEEAYLPHPSRCGVVIGHFNRLDFLELNLLAIRKHCGADLPILVSDDCSDGFGPTPYPDSPFGRVLALAEVIPNVVVWPNVERIGHTGGDMAAFWKGIVWGKQCGLDVIFKLSQRYIIDRANWAAESASELLQSGLATLGQSCAHGGWPLRTEAVGLHVPAWYRADVLGHLTPRRVQWPTEFIIWDDIVDRLDGRFHPWNLVTEGRFTPGSQALFHTCNAPQDYQRLAKQLGMPGHCGFDCSQLSNYLFG